MGKRSASVGIRGDLLLRALGIPGLLGIAVIHLLDLPGKLQETPYLGWLYIALMVGCVAAAGLLLRRDARPGWALAVALAALTMIGYTLSRTTGLPASTGDIGNWGETLGVLSLIVEGAVVVLGVLALSGVGHGPGQAVELDPRTRESPPPLTSGTRA